MATLCSVTMPWFPLAKDAKDRFVNFKYNIIEVVWIFNQYPASKILMKKIQKKMYFFLSYILIFIDTSGHMIILLIHKTCIVLAYDCPGFEEYITNFYIGTFSLQMKISAL